MQSETKGMRFRFEGNRYIANMTASEIHGDGVYGSAAHNIPIELPDGRFIEVYLWRLSNPPQPGKCVVINCDRVDNYATAELLAEN